MSVVHKKPNSNSVQTRKSVEGRLRQEKRRRDGQERRQEEAEGARPFLANAAARSIAPGRWRMAAGSAIALLLAGWIGVYQMGAPVWVPWTPRAEQPDAPGADKAKAAAEAEARAKAEQAEKERLAAAKAEEDRKAQAAADAEAKRKSAEAEQQRLAARAPAAGKSAAPTEPSPALRDALVREPRLPTKSPPPTDRLIRTFAEFGRGPFGRVLSCRVLS